MANFDTLAQTSGTSLYVHPQYHLHEWSQSLSSVHRVHPYDLAAHIQRIVVNLDPKHRLWTSPIFNAVPEGASTLVTMMSLNNFNIKALV